jgi:NAD(P)-dependent dehydrogenase (short-subunit alcohol dehydrogenase family)
LKQLEGKVALVTGAGSGGTGTAMSVRFAAEGAKVALVARNEQGLERTAARIRDLGGEALVLPCDLGDPDGGRDTLVARAEERLGPIDVLVNNAVKNDVKRFWEYSLSDLQSDGEVNLWAPWLLIQQATESMAERGGGYVLNMSSMGAELPPGPPFTAKTKWHSTLYAAMKSALNAATVYGAVEFADKGIVMNTLAPQRSILTERISSGTSMVKDTSICEPLETMAEAALALCTGDKELMTGRIAFSLMLLVELQRPVHDLTGTELVEGWQPRDIVDAIHYREDWTAKYLRWPHTYEFNRPQTPYPEVLRRG